MSGEKCKLIDACPMGNNYLSPVNVMLPAIHLHRAATFCCFGNDIAYVKLISDFGASHLLTEKHLVREIQITPLTYAHSHTMTSNSSHKSQSAAVPQPGRCLLSRSACSFSALMWNRFWPLCQTSGTLLFINMRRKLKRMEIAASYRATVPQPLKFLHISL